jgi:hypothetical protein
MDGAKINTAPLVGTMAAGTYSGDATEVHRTAAVHPTHTHTLARGHSRDSHHSLAVAPADACVLRAALHQFSSVVTTWNDDLAMAPTMPAAIPLSVTGSRNHNGDELHVELGGHSPVSRATSTAARLGPAYALALGSAPELRGARCHGTGNGAGRTGLRFCGQRWELLLFFRRRRRQREARAGGWLQAAGFAGREGRCGGAAEEADHTAAARAEHQRAAQVRAPLSSPPPRPAFPLPLSPLP